MAEFDAQDVLERSLAAHTVKSGNQDFNQLGGSIGVLHEPTGLLVNVGAGTEDDNLVEKTTRFAGTGVDDGQDFWAIQAGIERKFIELGKTTIYGEYYNYEGGGKSRRTIDGPDGGVSWRH